MTESSKTLDGRVSALESDNSRTKDDVQEIMRLLRVASEANARTAVQLDELTHRMNAAHSPLDCPNTSRLTDLQQVYWAGKGILWLVGGGGIALGSLLTLVLRLVKGH